MNTTNFIIVMARSYPFWAAPLSLSFLGAAIALFRKKHVAVAIYCGVVGMLFLVGVVLYFVFDGYGRLVPTLHEYLSPPPSL
jgi:hypothetical protein